jgi:hypothetical protein
VSSSQNSVEFWSQLYAVFSTYDQLKNSDHRLAFQFVLVVGDQASVIAGTFGRQCPSWLSLRAHVIFKIISFTEPTELGLLMLFIIVWRLDSANFSRRRYFK